LYSLQIENGAYWKSEARGQQEGFIDVTAERGPIVDRHGRAMAVSVPAGSVYIRPRQVRDNAAVADVLQRELQIDGNHVSELLTRPAPFVWVKRQIPRVIAKRIEAAAVPGVGVTLESRRYYPYGAAASPILGMVGMDGQGLSGLEARYERQLAAPEMRSFVFRDALGKRISAGPEVLDIPRGQDLSLTLDADFQLILDEELNAVARERKAKGAFGVLINGRSGEILALGQSPSKNLNSEGISDRSELSSLALETVFEPGSILKPVIAAGLLESGKVKSTDFFDCQNGRLKVGRHTIKDVKPVDVVSFHDVVVRSSNIGMSLAAQRLGKQGLHHILTGFRFKETSGLGFSGESRGILRDVANWAEIDVATHSFGQGVAVSPMQLVRAFSVFTNDGVMTDLSLVQNQPLNQSHTVVQPQTAAAVRRMLIDIVTAEHGTGKKAAVPGVIVGGKTGTAQKARTDGRGYIPGAYITSFIGFADTNSLGLSDTYILLISVDEPKGDFRYGGVIAAPVFQRVISRIVQHKKVDKRFAPTLKSDEEILGGMRLVAADQLAHS
jgi:cell division protein FtsI (penicillin-binding protein 3)